MRCLFEFVFGFALAATCWAGGVWFGSTYESKMVVTIHLAAIETAVLAIRVPTDQTYIYGTLLAGGDQWISFVNKKMVPPRCRSTPKGYGCIDWRDVGESAESWSRVLNDRTKP